MVRHEKMNQSIKEKAQQIQNETICTIKKICSQRMCPAIHFVGDVGYSKTLKLGIYILMAVYVNMDTKPWTREKSPIGINIFPCLSKDELMKELSSFDQLGLFKGLDPQRLLKHSSTINKVFQSDSILDRLQAAQKKKEYPEDPFTVDDIAPDLPTHPRNKIPQSFGQNNEDSYVYTKKSSCIIKYYCIIK